MYVLNTYNEQILRVYIKSLRFVDMSPTIYYLSIMRILLNVSPNKMCQFILTVASRTKSTRGLI